MCVENETGYVGRGEKTNFKFGKNLKNNTKYLIWEIFLSFCLCLSCFSVSHIEYKQQHSNELEVGK